MIQTLKRFIIVFVLSLTVMNLSAEPSDYGRPSDYSNSGSSFLSLDSTFGFILFLVIGIFCAIIFLLGDSDKKDNNSKGCGFVILIMIILGCFLKCSH